MKTVMARKLAGADLLPHPFEVSWFHRADVHVHRLSDGRIVCLMNGIANRGFEGEMDLEGGELIELNPFDLLDEFSGKLFLADHVNKG